MLLPKVRQTLVIHWNVKSYTTSVLVSRLSSPRKIRIGYDLSSDFVLRIEVGRVIISRSIAYSLGGVIEVLPALEFERTRNLGSIPDGFCWFWIALCNSWFSIFL